MGVGPEGVVLHSGKSRRGKLIILVVVGAFWNALSWFMWVMAYRDGEWVAVAFLSLFVLIGLGLVAAVAHAALALGNPSVTVTLDRASATLGEPLSVEWALGGNVGRLERFRVFVEGREEATYRRGTDTTTDRHVFRTIDVVDVSDRASILTAGGRASVTLPVDTMPTWVAGRNKVVWSLKACGTIRRWPDVDDAWDLTVLPAGPAAGGAVGGGEGVGVAEGVA